MFDSSTPGTMLSRRRFAQGGGALAAALLGLNLPNVGADQGDFTPPDIAIETGPAPETIAEVVTRLNFDRAAIFAFVRDEIAYEPYAGILRGPQGTLWARAGNSTDQALLLAELFAAAQISFRFAIGSLDQDQATRLDTNAAGAAAENQATFDRKMAAAYRHEQGDAPQPSASNAQPALDEIAAAAESGTAMARAAYERMANLLQETLDRDGATVALLAQSPVPAMERDEHAWLQIPDGPTWVDIDPTFPEAAPGDAFASLVTTSENLDDRPRHIVRFRIVVEEVIGGKLKRRDGAVREFTSDELINVPVTFMVAPSESFAAFGQSIRGLFEGELTLNPVIIHGTGAELGQTSIVFGSSEDSLFDLFEEATPASANLPGEGEAVAMWYAVDVLSPGADPITVERTWFDRLGGELRLQPEIDLTAIAPIETYTSANGDTLVRGLERVTILSIDVARLPSWIAFGNSQVNEAFSNANAMGPSYTTVRDTLGLMLEQERGYATAIPSPQVTAFTFVPGDPTSTSSEILVSADLLVHTPTVVRFGQGEETGLHPAISAGITDQVAEQVMLRPTSWSLEPVDDQLAAAVPDIVHIGAVFEAAKAQGIRISVIAGTDEVIAPATATSAIQSALDAGLIVIAPERTVDLDGAARLGWWLIDPATGATRDVMDTGGGSVTARIAGRPTAFFSPMTQYITAFRLWWAMLDGLKCFYAVAKLGFALWGISRITDPDTQGIALGAWYYFGIYDLATGCTLI